MTRTSPDDRRERGMRAPTRRRGRRRSRGQSLVEFALVVPIFLLILSGIFDFGMALYSRISIINAAREGARAAAVAADHTTIPTTAQSRASAVVSGAGMTTSAPTTSIVVSCVAISSSGSCSFSSASGSKAGDAVEVAITYQYRSLFPLLFGRTFTLGASVQMVTEQ
jgi:Flp pilus assembly protein TadG